MRFERSQIRWTQNSVKSKFSRGIWAGQEIEVIVNALKTQAMTFDHPLIIFRKTPEMNLWPTQKYTSKSGRVYSGHFKNLKDYEIYTLNNRGLLVLTLANIKYVEVRWATPPEIMKFSYQYDTDNFGTSVCIRVC